MDFVSKSPKKCGFVTLQADTFDVVLRMCVVCHPCYSTCPLYTCRPPLPHGADQGPDSSRASGGRVVHAGATPGPV